MPYTGKGMAMLSTLSLKSVYEEQGYVVARQLFTPDEVAALRDHYMQLRTQGSHPGDLVGVDATSNDPLKRYPRMIHMHRWDETSLRWMIDPRLNACMSGLLGREPYAVQTMLYFKPAGARGQALHQDNYYLRVQPELGNDNREPLGFTLTVHRDVPSLTFFVIVFGLLALPPIFAAFRYHAFEQMRWRESDYAPTTSDDE